MGSNSHTRPPWSLEECRANAIKGNVRKKQIAREREAATARRIEDLEAKLADALARIPIGDDARRQTTLSQIDSLDELINRALDRKDSDEFLRLSSAKEKLWKLVQPTAGVSKPVRSQQRAGLPSAVRTPQAAAIPTAENPSKAQ